MQCTHVGATLSRGTEVQAYGKVKPSQNSAMLILPDTNHGLVLTVKFLCCPSFIILKAYKERPACRAKEKER